MLKNIANIYAAPYSRDHRDVITLSYIDLLEQNGKAKQETKTPDTQDGKSAAETARDIFKQMRKGGRKNRPFNAGGKADT